MTVSLPMLSSAPSLRSNPVDSVQLPDAVDLGRFGHRVRFAGRTRPVMLICETVNICNNDCIICAYEQMSRPKTTMTTEVFAKVVDDYVAMGGGAFSLTPVVGDAFLDSRLPERLEMLDRPEITIRSMTTNGVRALKLDKRVLQTMLGRLDNIFVSMYGLDAAEYQTMARKDHFAKSVEAVRRILSLLDDPNKLRLGFRLLHERPETEIAKWVKETFSADIPFHHTTNYANWAVLDTTVPLPGDAQWTGEKVQDAPCLIPLVAAQIHADGNVSLCPCDDFDGNPELSLGNVMDAPLLDLWNSQKMSDYWASVDNLPAFCRKCTYYNSIETIGDADFLFDDPIRYIGG